MREVVGVAVVAVAMSGCGRDPMASPRQVPETLTTVTAPSASGIVGGPGGVWTVRLTDSSGTPIPGALVTFAISLGSGRVAPSADTTDADGTVSTTLTLGTIPGANEISASVAGLTPLRSVQVAGTAGPSQTFILGTRSVRFNATQDSAIVAFTPRDAFGNTTTGPSTFISRNPAVATVTNAGTTGAFIRAQSRPAQTWVVATHGSAVDSVLVSAIDGSSTACTFMASPIALAVGESASFESTAIVCVKTATTAEYVLVAHYGTTVSNAVASANFSAAGVTLPAPYPAPSSVAGALTIGETSFETAFERGLRQRERQIETRAPAARAWMRSRQPALLAQAKEGDLLAVNVNAAEYCANPSNVSARVAAITDAAVILADVSNPDGGFTDEEYRAIGRTIDTLVYPVDTAAFGAPLDIDGNGRIAVLFSKAVNALTPRTSSGVVLGFFYSRDLLPRHTAFGDCPGSNAGEIFYILVPDPMASVSGARSKAFVQASALPTIAHELQHLINASRRLYVNDAITISEEAWLNEGLSHVAEELVFYRSSGRAPRQNIDAGILGDANTRAAFDQFQTANFRRYQEYLRLPASGSPIAENDQLSTRGASWAFLRYLADRAGASDGDFWRRIVNARNLGINNVDQVLAGTGLTVRTALRDWAVAVAVDDLVGSSTGALTQASWHFLSAFSQVGFSDWLAPTAIVAGSNLQAGVRGGSSAYTRFAAPAGQEALVQATGPQGTPVPGMSFTIVRIK